MRTRHLTRHARLGALVLSCIPLFSGGAGWALDSFREMPAPGAIRDVVLDAQHGRAYLAVYDKDNVRAVDLATGRTVGEASCPKGPVALAMNPDGTLLAVLSKLSRSVALVRLPGMEIAGTAACGDGAAGITALPDGGFIVANSFADTLTIIDPANPGAPATIEGVASVPNAIAVAGDVVAVTTRTPPAVLFFHRNPGAAAAKSVPLKGAPSAIAALGDDRFVVAAGESVMVLSAASGEVIATRSSPALDVAASEGEVYVLTPDSLVRCDTRLKEQETYPSAAGGRRVEVASGMAALAAPSGAFWFLSAPTSPVAVASVTPVAPVTEPAPVSAPVVEPIAAVSPEPEPVPVPVAAPASIAEAAIAAELMPAVESAPAVESTSPTPEPSPVATVESEPTPPSPESTAIPAPEDASVSRRGKLPRGKFGSMDVHAPSFTREAPTFGAKKGRTISDSLAQAMKSGQQPSGFEPPDWRKPWENITGDVIQVIPKVEVKAKGNVRFTLDTIQFSADELYYQMKTGEIDARGNVIIRQGGSIMQADHIRYVVPVDLSQEPIEQKTLTLPDDTAPEGELSAREALRLGHITGENVYISEPHREIIAETMDFNLADKTGDLTNAEGYIGGIYFGAEKLKLTGPQDATGEDIWVSTCDADPPEYRLRLSTATIEDGDSITATGAHLMLGGFHTPLYWPRWGYRVSTGRSLGFSFDSGHNAEIGYFVNVGQTFPIAKGVELGYRLYPTSKEGVGFGLEGGYDFMKSPESWLFRGKGDFRAMATTENSGFSELHHRQEFEHDMVLLLQWEQWFKHDFLKDWYYDEYRDRASPRTFVNLTMTKPDYIVTATVRASTNDFVDETERLPEATFHLLERPLMERLYLSFDTINGYNEREPKGEHAVRSVNVARLTLDLDLTPALSLTPFTEVEGAWYSELRNGKDGDIRASALAGATLQTRFHRNYASAWGFSEFRHTVIPSLTYSYRNSPDMSVASTPRFDPYDSVYGRSRMEAKIENILMGRDAETKESWQLARLSLYLGNDFSNELRKSGDYEFELDVRPRPWWGVQMAGESHHIANEASIDDLFFWEQLRFDIMQDIFEDDAPEYDYYRLNSWYGDYDRMLAYLYYDDQVYSGRLNARIGFSYTETRDQVYNREILYGIGYKVSDDWSFAVEQRFDLERNELYRQTYEVRRRLHCWEAAIKVRDRNDGWDVGFEMSLVAFPGTKLKF